MSEVRPPDGSGSHQQWGWSVTSPWPPGWWSWKGAWWPFWVSLVTTPSSLLQSYRCLCLKLWRGLKSVTHRTCCYHKRFCYSQEVSPHLFFRHPRGRCDRRDAASGPNRPSQQSSKEEEASREKNTKEEKERAGVWTLSPVWCVEWTTVSIFPLYGSNIDGQQLELL